MFTRILIFAFLLFISAIAANAQSGRTNQQATVSKLPDASQREEPALAPGDTILETRKKMEIRAAKEDHQELIERGETIALLSDQLQKSFEQHGRLNMSDANKLENLEKTIKRVRKALGGDDDEELSQDQPTSLSGALELLVKTGTQLSDDLKKSSRLTISADSIENANKLLELVRFIRNSQR